MRELSVTVSCSAWIVVLVYDRHWFSISYQMESLTLLRKVWLFCGWWRTPAAVLITTRTTSYVTAKLQIHEWLASAAQVSGNYPTTTVTWPSHMTIHSMTPPIKSRLRTSCTALHFVTTEHSYSELTIQSVSTSSSFSSFHNKSDNHPLRTTNFPLDIWPNKKIKMVGRS